MTFLLIFLFKEIIVGLGNSLHQETVRDPQDSAAVVPEFEKYRSKAEADVARLREETNGLKEKVEMLEGQLSKEKARSETAEMVVANQNVEMNLRTRDLNAERDRCHELQKKADQYKEIIDKALPGLSVKVKRVNR